MNRKEKEKKIILTFDYELSLGIDSGTPAKCIIEPADIILELLAKHDANGIFFIDATYLLTLAKKKDKDLNLIKDNIKKIIKSGNDIGLHLHPQWLDAYKLENGRWSFKTFERYRLHSLDIDELNDLFKKAKKVLDDIVHEERKNYQIECFRAGGWSIQPFSILKDIFEKNKFKFDFSVNPGLYSQKESYAFYDFRKAMHSSSYWYFDYDVCKSIPDGNFIEIPVTTLKIRKLFLLINYYFFKKKEKEINDGKYINNKKSKKNIFLKLFALFKIFNHVYTSVSVDGLHFNLFKKLLKKIGKSNFEFSTFVCHPKKLSESSFKNIEYLIENYKTLNLKEIKGIIFK